jgi:hypothetical protein
LDPDEADALDRSANSIHPNSTMFRNHQNNNQKSKNHDTFVWSLYVKSVGNVSDFSKCAAALQSGGVTADDGTCTEKFRQESERSPCMLDPYQNNEVLEGNETDLPHPRSWIKS